MCTAVFYYNERSHHCWSFEFPNAGIARLYYFLVTIHPLFMICISKKKINITQSNTTTSVYLAPNMFFLLIVFSLVFSLCLILILDFSKSPFDLKFVTKLFIANYNYSLWKYSFYKHTKSAKISSKIKTHYFRFSKLNFFFNHVIRIM